MSERVFYSIEELKAYLQERPEDEFVKVVVEVRSDGEEDDEEQ